MGSTDITHGVVIEDSTATCLARVVKQDDGSVAQKADVSTIVYSVFDVTASPETTEVDAVSVSVAASMYDSLQTDSRWSKDDTGFNFAHVIAATVFATGNHRYRIEYKFTFADGSVTHLRYMAPAEDLKTS